jgi:predicted AlkP superfamily pyrophosphatase or phosphodiesterase
VRRTAIINVVGLTEALVGGHTPRIRDFLARGDKVNITPAFPAVTCTAQSTYLTGATPHAHGIVGNGWYDRDLAEVQFWKQSNHLVHSRKLWDELRELDPQFTCAKLFWWYNMYATADFSITPRPMYPADGRKVFDIYTHPFSIREKIKADLGDFPFPTFWGPAAGVPSPQGGPDAASRWIAESAKWIERHHHPTLNLVYLPHLDYNLQRHGPFMAAGVATPSAPIENQKSKIKNPSEPPQAGGEINPAIIPDLRAIDAIVGDLIEFFRERSVQVVLLSEYGITNVDTAIHLNRHFREEGWVAIKTELGLELMDCGASKVFAVADHQVAHIYLNDRSLEAKVCALLQQIPGIGLVMDLKAKQALGIDHPRAGEIIAVAKENAWFTYYYWFDDRVAPDFARTVDIHRKPGYDPVELFLDPEIQIPKLKIAWRLLQKKLGFRMLMDLIPLDSALVKGSHGCRPEKVSDYPLLITEKNSLPTNSLVQATDVYHMLRRIVVG